MSPVKAVLALTLRRCAAIFEKQGVPLEGFGRPGETHLRATYESGVLFVLRFMVDTGVVRLLMREVCVDVVADRRYHIGKPVQILAFPIFAQIHFVRVFADGSNSAL